MQDVMKCFNKNFSEKEENRKITVSNKVAKKENVTENISSVKLNKHKSFNKHC